MVGLIGIDLASIAASAALVQPFPKSVEWNQFSAFVSKLRGMGHGQVLDAVGADWTDLLKGVTMFLAIAATDTQRTL